MVLSQILIILRVTNAFSSLGHKGCISMIKSCEIRKEIKKSNSLFNLSCFNYYIIILSILQKVGDKITKK